MIGLGVAITAIGTAVYFLSPALVTLGTAAGFSAGPLLALGAAVLMIGGGIGIAAAGIGFMAKGIAEMFTAMDIPKSLALGALLAGIAIGAPFLILGGVGLGAMALGMAALGLSLKFVSTRDLEAIALFSSSLANIKVAEIKAVASAIGEVADAMDRIDTPGAFVFRHIMDTTSVTAAAIAAMSGTPAPPVAAAAPRMQAAGGQAAEVTVNFTLDQTILDSHIVKVSKGERGRWAATVVQGTGNPIT